MEIVDIGALVPPEFLLPLLLSGFSALGKTLFFLPTPRGAIIRRQNSLLSLAEKEGFPVSAEKDLPFPFSGSQRKEGEVREKTL
jgi:hypothetical protein